MLFKKLILTALLASTTQLALAEEQLITSEDFEDTNIENWSWSQQSVSSNYNWRYREWSGSGIAQMSGFNADSDSNDWLISSAIDLSALDLEFVYTSFDNEIDFDGPATRFLVSTDYSGDVAAATWVDLSENVTWSAGDIVNSDKIDLSAYAGQTIYLAFHYTSTPSEATRIGIDNVQVVNTDEDPAVITEYVESFGGSLGEWTGVSLASDRDWQASSYSGNGFARMSGYNGDVHSDDYLVSPTFDLTEWEAPYLEFSSAKNFDGDPLRALITTNYTGDVTTTEWIDLSDVVAWSEGSYDWVKSGRVDLRSYLGDATTITVAFHYTSSDAGAATWQIDDVVVGRFNPAVIEVVNSDQTQFASLNDGFGDWQAVNLSGANGWQENQKYDGAIYAKISGFGDDANSDDWLISPTFDTESWAAKSISFFSATRYTGPVIKVLVSPDFADNVDSATWIDISDRAALSQGDYEWVDSTEINVSDLITGNATFAFHYTSDESGSATWQIDSISVGGEKAVRPVESNFTTYSLEEFESGFNNWTAVSIVSDRNWESKVSIDTNYVEISGFGGDVNSNDWLVSPTIDTTAVDWDNAFIQFSAAKRYDGENLKLLVSTDYAGDVETATWTNISDLAGLAKRNQETGELYDTNVWDAGTYEWVDSGEVDLTNFIGGNITVAIQYTSSDSSATWRVDYARIIEKDDGFSDEPYTVVQPGAGSTGVISILGLLLLGIRRRLA